MAGLNNRVVISGDQSSQGDRLTIVRATEGTLLEFKIIGNPRVTVNGNPVSFVKVFSHYFKFKVNGQDKFISRSCKGKDDPITILKNNIKNEVAKIRTSDMISSAYVQQTELLVKFLSATCANYALAVFPSDPEIKVVEIKTTAMKTIEELEEKANREKLGSVYDLGSPNQPAGVWLAMSKTGKNFDTKYPVEISTVLSEVDVGGGRIQRVPIIKNMPVHPSIFTIDTDTEEGMSQIPDIKKHAEKYEWTVEEDADFLSALNWPTLEQCAQSGYVPSFEELKTKLIMAVPSRLHAYLGLDSTQQQPVYQQPAPQPVPQQPVYQQPAPQPVQQQPVPQQPVYQQPTPQPVPQTHAQQPAPQPVYQTPVQPQQPQKVDSSDIDNLINGMSF